MGGAFGSMEHNYMLMNDGNVPPGWEPIKTFQEGIEAAKSLGYSGDSVAHGAYCATDPNIFGNKRPRGMFRSHDNGRFHFNCGAAGNDYPNDQILVKKTENLKDVIS